MKRGVRLITEMRFSFEIFVEWTVRHVIENTVYTKSHVYVPSQLVVGNFETNDGGQNWGRCM